MYLISRSSHLELPIRSQRVEYNQHNGQVERVIPALSVKFMPAGNVPPYAREAVAGLSNWGTGLGHYESGEPEDPFTRCGAYDTDIEAELQGWSAEDKAFVENALLKAASNGIEYVVVNAPATAKPWGRYDEIVGEQAAEQIAFYVNELGIDPGQVLNYERENGAREDVIAAMERALEKANEDIVGVISA